MKISDREILPITNQLYSGIEKYQRMNRLHDEDIPQFKKNVILPLHPHQVVRNQEGEQVPTKYKCTEIFCDLKPGRFCCCDSTPPGNGHVDLGIAMCLYFKFLKHMAVIFLFMSIFSMIPILLYYKVADSNDVEITKSYKEFLFSSSIGVMSLQEIKCEYHYNQTAPITSANFTLRCPTGFVVRSGPTYTENAYESITNCNQELKKLSEGTDVVTGFDQDENCDPESTECQVNITTTNLNSDFRYMSYVYNCADAKYDVGQLQLEKITILIIAVAIDIIGCILLLIFLCSQNRAEQAEAYNFGDLQVSLRNYSLQVNGFDSKNFFTEVGLFLKEIQKKSDALEKNIDICSRIVQIKTTENSKESWFYKKRQVSRKIFGLIRDQFFEKSIDPSSYQTEEQFIKGHFESQDGSEKLYKKYQKKLTGLLNKFSHLRENQGVGRDRFSEDTDGLNSRSNKQRFIIITFSNPEYKNLLYGWRTKDCCSKPSLKLGTSDMATEKTKQYLLSEPPVPDLVQGKNIQKSSIEKFLRRLLSWLLTLLLICGSILLIGFAISRQRIILEEYKFNVDCSSIFPSEEFESFDQGRATAEDFYEHCACSANSILSSVRSPEFEEPCEEWSEQYFLYLSIPLLFSLGIVVFNVVISYLFYFFSSFEAHSLLNDQMTSYIIKRSTVLILNTGVILTVLNFDYDLQGGFLEIYSGVYRDFTGDWYFTIGIIIVLTIVFNMLFPLLELMLYAFLRMLRLCWDKKCLTRATSTKYKHEYLQVHGGFVYPIEERYSTIIAVLFISLLFNGAVPLINPILVVFFTFLYLTDKFLVFKLFRKLQNYENTLHKNMTTIIYILLILHLLLTAFLFTSPYIREEDSDSEIFDSSDERFEELTASRFGKVFTTYYSLPFVVLFALLVLCSVIYLFFKQICFKLIRVLCCCCFGENSKYLEENRSPSATYLANPGSTNFYDTLSKSQVKHLIDILEHQMEKENKIIERISNDQDLKSKMSKASSPERNPPEQRSFRENGDQRANKDELKDRIMSDLRKNAKYKTFLEIEDRRKHKLNQKIEEGGLSSRMLTRPQSNSYGSGNKSGIMIGSASYEKQQNEMKLQEEIQVLFLDNLTAQIKEGQFIAKGEGSAKQAEDRPARQKRQKLAEQFREEAGNESEGELNKGEHEGRDMI